MKLLMIPIIALLAGCASTKQFLRPMNYHGVEKAKQLMQHQGYAPIEGTDKTLWVVAGEDADLYLSELEEYYLTRSLARTAQMQGEAYTLPTLPDIYGLRTITADDWFESNRSGDNVLANVVDTLWNGLLVGGTLYVGQELGDTLEGDGSSKNESRTITAGGDVNYIENSTVGGNVGSPPQEVTVEGLEP